MHFLRVRRGPEPRLRAPHPLLHYDPEPVHWATEPLALDKYDVVNPMTRLLEYKDSVSHDAIIITVPHTHIETGGAAASTPLRSSRYLITLMCDTPAPQVHPELRSWHLIRRTGSSLTLSVRVLRFRYAISNGNEPRVRNRPLGIRNHNHKSYNWFEAYVASPARS